DLDFEPVGPNGANGRHPEDAKNPVSVASGQAREGVKPPQPSSAQAGFWESAGDADDADDADDESQTFADDRRNPCVTCGGPMEPGRSYQCAACERDMWGEP